MGPRGPQRRSVAASWPCNQTRLIKTYEPWVSLAVVRSDHKKVDASYSLKTTKEQSVSSRLGVAVKDGGGLSLGGRVTVSTTWSVSFGPWANTAKQYETQWSYGTFRTKRCLRGVDVWEFRDRTEPIAHLKGVRVVKPGPYDAPYCRPAAPTQDESIDAQRNIEWSGGVQLAAKGFSVDLSAQTGYSEVDKLRFKWAKNYKGRGHLCGQLNEPVTITLGGKVPRGRELVGSLVGR